MDDPGRKRRIAGVLHVHTTFSDGEFSLAELRRVLLGEGIHFAALTDHAEGFTADTLAEYLRECQALSDPQFVFLPGLEFECELRMHILGYGCLTLPGSRDPAVVTAHIRSAGGIPVLAHPLPQHLETLEVGNPGFRGVETWNSKYDGRYAPRTGPFDLVQSLRRRGEIVHAFFGLDLHWKTQYRGLRTLVTAEALEPSQLLKALGAGMFAGAAGGIEMTSDGLLPGELRTRFHGVHQRATWMRSLLKRGKRFADQLGLRVPARVKNMFRRIM